MMESICRSMKRSAVLAALLLGIVMVTAPMAFAVTAVSSDGQEIQDAFAEGITKALPFGGSGKLSAAMLAEDAGAPSYDEIKALLPATAGFGAESVIGMDTRVRVYTSGATPSGSNYPARATALITFTGGYCTGFFIGDNTVATAGHCVHSGGSAGAWRTNVRVYPGYNAGVAPYGSFPARNLWSNTGWTVSASPNFDYGVVKLSVNAGNTVGWYGFSWSSLSRLNFPAIVMGYAGDKSPARSMWIGADKVRVSGTYQLSYQTDTFGGQSGSAVWYDANGPYAIAIHAYGGTINSGTRITQSVFNFLLARRNEP